MSDNATDMSEEYQIEKFGATLHIIHDHLYKGNLQDEGKYIIDTIRSNNSFEELRTIVYQQSCFLCRRYFDEVIDTNLD